MLFHELAVDEDDVPRSLDKRLDELVEREYAEYALGAHHQPSLPPKLPPKLPPMLA
jgi:hypothetical protein